jgi:hypothetical protein
MLIICVCICDCSVPDKCCAHITSCEHACKISSEPPGDQGLGQQHRAPVNAVRVQVLMIAVEVDVHDRELLMLAASDD